MNLNINPIIPLAYNLADGRGKYILFVGAGVSKDANVPTGWDILLETLRIIRNQEDGKYIEYSNEEMEKYYEENYSDIEYPELIGNIFPSNEEQRSFLKKFFDGKSPGKSHQLIAECVKRGLIRFVVTTNFDSLIERALDESGLQGKYSVISNGEQVLTSKPWHNEEYCRIYKLHGTIEQGKIRNTRKDLEKLDGDLGKDFSDIAEKHGIISLGYDGRDKGVMKCFNARKYKGYTLYWCTHKNKPNNKVKSLVNRQEGIFINIENASEFLDEVLARVEIAVSGIEQRSEAVAQARFKNIILSKSADIEIGQAIDDQKRKLKLFIVNTLEELDPNNYESLWEGFIKIFNYSKEFLLYSEQIIKYRDNFWPKLSSIFEDVHSINQSGYGHGTDGVVNYFFFVILEMFGGIILESKKFNLFRNLLEIKKLSRQKDAMRNILDWNIQAQFIEKKNANDTSKWIVPKFHYLLQLIESQENIFDFDIKSRVFESDLLFYVFTVNNSTNSFWPSWVPRAAVYFSHGSPDFFKRIKVDAQFGELIASTIFNIQYDELLNLIIKAREIFNEKFQSIKFNSFSEIFREF